MFVSTEMAGIRYYDYVVSVNNTPVASHVNLYEVRLLSPGHNIHKAEQIEVHVSTVYMTMKAERILRACHVRGQLPHTCLAGLDRLVGSNQVKWIGLTKTQMTRLRPVFPRI